MLKSLMTHMRTKIERSRHHINSDSMSQKLRADYDKDLCRRKSKVNLHGRNYSLLPRLPLGMLILDVSFY